MPKLRRILRLVNLLYHRSAVSRRLIVSECGVSERTAYRYITAISEAGIPVYFDETRSGYRLTTEECLSIGEFNVGDIVMLLAGLACLEERVNCIYGDSARDLGARLRSSQAYPIDDVVKELGAATTVESSTGALDQKLTLAILRAATATASPVTLHIRKPGCGILEHRVQHPKLVLSEDWEVHYTTATLNAVLSLSSIVGVRAMRSKPQSGSSL